MHALLIGGSAILACIQLTSTWLLARRQRTGWLMSVTANIVGAAYDMATGQYGFLPVVALNLIMAARAWHLWGHEVKQASLTQRQR